MYGQNNQYAQQQTNQYSNNGYGQQQSTSTYTNANGYGQSQTVLQDTVKYANGVGGYNGAQQTASRTTITTQQPFGQQQSTTSYSATTNGYAQSQTVREETVKYSNGPVGYNGVAQQQQSASTTTVPTQPFAIATYTTASNVGGLNGYESYSTGRSPFVSAMTGQVLQQAAQIAQPVVVQPIAPVQQVVEKTTTRVVQPQVIQQTVVTAPVAPPMQPVVVSQVVAASVIAVPTAIVGGLIQRAETHPFRLTTYKHTEQGQIYVSSDVKDGDNLVEFCRNKLDPRSLFVLRRSSRSKMGYLLYNGETSMNLFVSNDYKNGEQLIEARCSIDEERSRFRVVHDGVSNFVQFVAESGETLFASNEQKNGSYLLAASHRARDRSTLQLDFA